ncbi:MAG: DUF2339 domain-containing protein [gamma proteobacterium symbiont of Bathyaustriella thionipta]|nr:DUF2339 domain-containing protein [gamma proteobacterium symbiont of Bathyaustriella thionipta]
MSSGGIVNILLLAVVGLGVGIVLTFMDRDSVIVLLTTVTAVSVGLLLDLKQRVRQLRIELQQLRFAMKQDWEERHQKDVQTEPDSAPNMVEAPVAGNRPIEEEQLVTAENSTAVKPVHLAPITAAAKQASPLAEIQAKKTISSAAASGPIESMDVPLTQVPSETGESRTGEWGLLGRFFSDGSLFVRVGVLLLFFGAAFLVKLAAEKMVFPIELRLVTLAASGLAVVWLGYRLRHRNPVWSLVTQGGGMGLFYITVYAAFRLYALIPASGAFALLLAACVGTAWLAVRQNARTLLSIGIAGGFLAPVLASTGSGSHVILFSYYALLNLLIFAVAWFKSWRTVNLLGFGFTFFIGALWGLDHYRDAWFASTEPFLILFFVFYVAISILYALKQPPRLKGLVDGTLVFGTPIIAFALQTLMVWDMQKGVAWSAFILGIFYLLLTLILHRLDGQHSRLLRQAFLALGIVFVSLAVPYAFDAQQTSASWALEGLAILWVGLRQRSCWQVGFGGLLQLGAGLVFVSALPFAGETAFINSAFLGTTLIAVAALLSSALLYHLASAKFPMYVMTGQLLFGWGLLWWTAGALWQLESHFQGAYPYSGSLIVFALTALGLNVLAERLRWKLPRLAALLLIPLSFLLAFIWLTDFLHPAVDLGYLAWPLVFAISYWILWRCERSEIPGFSEPAHPLMALLASALLSWELLWQLKQWLPLDSPWLAAALILPTAALLLAILKRAFWPFNRHYELYLKLALAPLTLALLLWGLWVLANPLNMQPLPYLPLLNPLDLTQLALLFLLYRSLSVLFGRQQGMNGEHDVLWILSIPVFVWLNAMLLRSIHHWSDIPYQLPLMMQSDLVQTLISVFWAMSGVALMLLAKNSSQRRAWWLAGSLLLGVVVIKLFLVDLAASGTLERTVSFLVVGGLLVVIGYFVPLPPAAGDKTEQEKQA